MHGSYVLNHTESGDKSMRQNTRRELYAVIRRVVCGAGDMPIQLRAP